MNRRALFQNCSGHVMGVHNKAFSVLTLCGQNPKLSALVVRTYSVQAVRSLLIPKSPRLTLFR
jgi:hypothetical protein